MVKDKISVLLNGAETELFMSAGLLNRLTDIIGQSSTLVSFVFDGPARIAVLTAILEKKGRSGALPVPIDFDEIDLSMAEQIKLIDWASEHVTDFFLQMTESVGRFSKLYEGRLQSLMPSIDGLAASVTPTPSAGPSTDALAS
jgi:hypothetical protein